MFEVLMAMAMLTLVIVPMMESFGPALAATRHVERELVLTNQARATLNRVLSLAFNTLVANKGNPVDKVALFGSTAQAEDVSVRGKTYSPLIAIEDDSGGYNTLLRLTVTLDTVHLVTRKTDD